MGQVLGGAGDLTPPWRSGDSSLGRVPACDAGDPGSIPGGGKLNAWDQCLVDPWIQDPE